MTKAITLILVLNSCMLYGQRDTIIYFTKTNKTTDSENNALFYDKISTNKNKEYVLTSFTKVDDKWARNSESIIKLETDSTLSITSKEQKNIKTIRVFHKTDSGYYIKDYSKSIISQEGFSKLLFPLVRNGYWKIFNNLTGQIKSEGTYSNNRVLTNKYWISESNYLDDVFPSADKDPEYEGGFPALMKFIANNLVYPESAKENNITGRVILGFVVKKDGSIDGWHFIQRVNPVLDIEAIRVVSSMPQKWTAGEIDNKKVNVVFSIPVTFQIKTTNTIIRH